MVINMSWKEMKEKQNNEAVSEKEITENKYDLMKKKILSQISERQKRDRAFLLCSITGNPKVGKTGLALDCGTDEEKEKGMKIYVLDFDNGAEPTWDSAHDRDENIIIFNPIEMNSDGTTNWQETFDSAHAFCDLVKEDIENGNVKAVVLDGVDKVYEGSGDVLREHLVKSSKRDGSIVLDTDSIMVKPLDWKIRNNIYNRLLDTFCALKADRFLITHMKSVYGDIVNPVPVGEVPDWHKSTPAKFIQMIHINKIKQGKETKYIAELQASKTNSDLVGREWVIFSTNGKNAWYGIPELREGNI